ncbi:AIPR family protein [uncultured Roseibium sp.]|uniref:AIPR family protein n=1 Tax=uncultured Roseibium sp. TaxID=1936171 RepID=UPI0026297A77|nr:AIPR family protein [uncultured Roseibium sp.]
MKIDDLNFKELTQKQLKPYTKRAPTESLQFLRWLLEQILRLDGQDADDACVDAKQDKGVDGIFVNDVLEEVYVLQSKVKQNEKATLGDTELKEFVGTLKQFDASENIQALLDGNANEALKGAIIRNEIKDKISRGYIVEGIFCTNVPLNKDGKAYASTLSNVAVYDASRIVAEYVNVDAPTGILEQFSFDTSDSEVIKYQTSEGVSARIFLANALQMTHLKGISDGSLFSLNVRLSLGNTKVNKALLGSIRDKKEHKNFPLYHNGVTLLCEKFDDTKEGLLTVENYVVVNGAQSLSSLLQAKSSITQDLRILVKIIALGSEVELRENITQNSNNQNAIKPRDMRSNHGIQQRLKKEIRDLNYKEYAYEVKRGEANKSKVFISNEDAGLALLALDLGEPWACHQKYKVMDESHSKIFGRSDVTGAKVLLFYEIVSTIEKQSDEFEDKLFGNYTLTKFFLAHAVAEIIRESEKGRRLFSSPDDLLQENSDKKFLEIVSALVSTTICDLEAEVSELIVEGSFDYKRDLKSPKWCKNMVNKIKAAYKKDVKRKKAESIDDLLQNF